VNACCWALACALILPASAIAAAPAPYGTDDAGGFRNVLPPGEAGVANVFQLAQFEANGVVPKHYADQEPLHDGLLYASPSLTEADVPKYYKDATFGVKPEDVESTITPRPGVTIVRDKQFGIPHVYGDTFDDVEFGAGYAAAQDRLFLIDVLRHTGRATLSSFIGGSAGNRAQDQTRWAIAPYTEADLQKQVDQGLQRYGADGAKVKAGAEAFVAGMNQYIDEAKLDPTKLPAEYAALGKLPEHFAITDVIAEDALPVRDGARVLQARPGAARSRVGHLHAADRTSAGVGHRGRGDAAGHDRGADLARARRARLELAAAPEAKLAERPPARRDRPAGRLLPARDPDGGGAPRTRLRRPWGRLPGREPDDPARPRARLRLERHDGSLRQCTKRSLPSASTR
jgi:hypothetical protein